ncbi:hypothetical protein JCM8547_006757 [Rhodosporidiobolus lusitaniae]
MSSPPSDSSEPVLVSRPPSPSAPPPSSALPVRFRQERHDSPVPTPITVKDSPNETVSVLAPSASHGNTVQGGGRIAEEEKAHLNAPPIPGFAAGEGVVGAAQGKAPEYVARVAKVEGGGEGTTMTPPPEVLATAGEGELPLQLQQQQQQHDDDDADVDGSSIKSKQPKWFRKVKDSAASAASSIKEKARDLADQASNHAPSSHEGSIDLAAGDAGAARTRSRSIGARSAVSFSLADPHDGTTPLAQGQTSARSSLEVPRPLPKIVTDQDGRAVPVEVGKGLQGGTPTSSTPEGVVQPMGVQKVAGGNVSTTTSVRDKILESGYDVDPTTSHDKFHDIFKDLPEDEELIEDYRCALVRDILVQGKLYVSETYLSFRANILGWETSLQIPWSEIISIEKRMTAKIIPNAIEVRTLHATHTFSSFVARDASYALIVAIYRHANPDADKYLRENRAAAKEDRARRRRALSVSSARSAVTDTDDDDEEADRKSEISFEDEKGVKKRHRFRAGISAAVKSIRGRDTAVDDGNTSSSLSAGGGSGGGGGGPTEAEKVKAAAEGVHPPTSYDGPEFKNEALDVVVPTSPYKAFELFFKNEEFLKTFLEEKEQLREIDIGAWTPAPGASTTTTTTTADGDDSTLKQRDMTYIKPLNAPVGPKQTHCNIHDDNEKIDEESWISNLTRTRTPDVPSGDGFSVVTRTTFTWAEGGNTRVRVTTEVEWTKVNRILKGVIERGAIDGQKQYHRDLESAVRAYIDAHPAEYAVAGAAAPVPVKVEPVSTTSTRTGSSSSSGSGGGGGLLDSLPLDSPLTLALPALVVVLLFTNLYTLSSLRSSPARIGNPSEVASAVSRVLSDFNAAHAKRFLHAAEGGGGTGVVGELGELRETVVGLEKTLEGVVRELAGVIKTVREVADRTEGVRDLL